MDQIAGLAGAPAALLDGQGGRGKECWCERQVSWQVGGRGISRASRQAGACARPPARSVKGRPGEYKRAHEKNGGGARRNATLKSTIWSVLNCRGDERGEGAGCTAGRRWVTGLRRPQPGSSATGLRVTWRGSRAAQASLVPHGQVAAAQAKGEGAAAHEEARAGGVPEVGVAGVLDLVCRQEAGGQGRSAGCRGGGPVGHTAAAVAGKWEDSQPGLALPTSKMVVKEFRLLQEARPQLQVVPRPPRRRRLQRQLAGQALRPVVVAGVLCTAASGGGGQGKVWLGLLHGRLACRRSDPTL